MATYIPQQNEDDASAGGELAVPVLGVRNDTNASKTSNDGDFGMISLDVAGRLKISPETTLGIQTEDAAAVSGDKGLAILGVRNDAAASKTDADGDYSMVATDSAGRVGVSDLGGSITVDVGTTASDLGKAEDDPFASGDVGVQALAVRVQDVATPLSSDDGDYTPIAVTPGGAVVIAGYDFNNANVAPIKVDPNGGVYPANDNTISESFTTTGVGSVTYDNPGMMYYSLSVSFDAGAPATSWTVVAEASNDGLVFTTILTHGTADGNGKIVFSSSPKLSKQIRISCTALILGPATVITGSLIRHS